MTEVLHFPSSPTTNSQNPQIEFSPISEGNLNFVTDCDPSSSEEEGSLLALFVAILRKSVVVCKSTDRRELCAMEIGWPSNVRHVAHVTFDRFNGFLGLPVEFEPEVPRRAPSASTNCFSESRQNPCNCHTTPEGTEYRRYSCYCKGICTFKEAYRHAEGIFRINAENSQEEYVREQLNRGVIPEGIDVHCLAGLTKAWFRELPSGVLDSLAPEHVIQSKTEEDCVHLVRQLPPTESALLDWAINLMTDVVQHEHLNKMNARNIAMVFAPNMTQMADPLTALMYAVQVMNFLKTLILKTLREREDSIVEQPPNSRPGPHNENGGPHGPNSQPTAEEDDDIESDDNEEIIKHAFVTEEPVTESSPDSNQSVCIADRYNRGASIALFQKRVADGDRSRETTKTRLVDNKPSGEADGIETNCRKSRKGQSSNSNFNKWSKKPALLELPGPAAEKAKGIINASCIDSNIERVEAWKSELPGPAAEKAKGIFVNPNRIDSNIERIEAWKSELPGPAAEKAKGIINVSRIDSRTERIEAWR